MTNRQKYFKGSRFNTLKVSCEESTYSGRKICVGCIVQFFFCSFYIQPELPFDVKNIPPCSANATLSFELRTPSIRSISKSRKIGTIRRTVASMRSIDLVIQVYTNKQMPVGVCLDPRRSSTTSKSAEGLQKVGIMMHFFLLMVGSFNKSSPRS